MFVPVRPDTQPGPGTLLLIGSISLITEILPTKIA